MNQTLNMVLSAVLFVLLAAILFLMQIDIRANKAFRLKMQDWTEGLNK